MSKVKELIQKLRTKLASSSLDETMKKDLEDQLKELESANTPAPATPPAPEKKEEEGTVPAWAKGLQTQIESLTSSLAESERLRKEQADAIANQAKADRAKKITDKLTEAKAAGKIAPAKEAHFKKLLETDFETAVQVIDGLPVDPAAKPENKPADKTKAPQLLELGTNKGAMIDKIREMAQVSEN